MSLLSLIPRPLLRFGASVLSVRRKILFDAPLDEIRNLPVNSPVHYRFGDARDLPGLAVDPSFDEPAQAFARERLATGDRLVLGELERQVVYYGWLMPGQLDLGVRRYFPLPKGTVYSYRLFTAPSQRRKGLCAGYYSYVANELRRQGYTRAVSWVEARNAASVRVHENSGFRAIGSIWHCRILFRSFFFVAPSARARLAGTSFEGGRLAAGQTAV